MALIVQLTAARSRSEYTTMPALMIEELQRIAAGNSDTLAEAAGTWAGFARDEHTVPLCDAIETSILGCEPWLEVGRRRRGEATRTMPQNN